MELLPNKTSEVKGVASGQLNRDVTYHLVLGPSPQFEPGAKFTEILLKIDSNL